MKLPTRGKDGDEERKKSGHNKALGRPEQQMHVGKEQVGMAPQDKSGVALLVVFTLGIFVTLLIMLYIYDQLS